MITHRGLVEIPNPEQLGSVTEFFTSYLSAKRHPYLNSQVHVHETCGIGDPPSA